jgi:hypothetical protein
MHVTVTLDLDDNDLRTIARDMCRPGPASTDDIQWWVRTAVIGELGAARQNQRQLEQTRREDEEQYAKQRRNP